MEGSEIFQQAYMRDTVRVRVYICIHLLKEWSYLVSRSQSIGADSHVGVTPMIHACSCCMLSDRTDKFTLNVSVVFY